MPDTPATKKTYVNFFYRPLFLPVETTEEIISRNIENQRLPLEAIGFQYFDVFISQTVVDGETITIKSDPLNYSPKYFHGIRVLTLEEFEKEFPFRILAITGMKFEQWKKTIETKFYGFAKFPEDAVFIEKK